MKRKLQILIVGLMIILLQTGCAKIEANLTIRDDGSMEYTYFVGVKKEYNENGDPIINEEEANKYRKAGISVIHHEDDEYVGEMLDAHYDNIDQLTTIADTSCELDIYNKKIDNMYCFTKEKGFFGDTYKARIAVKPLRENFSKELEEEYEDDNTITPEIDHEETIENDDGTTTTIRYFKDGGVTEFTTDNKLTEQMAESANLLKSQLKGTFNVKLPVKVDKSNALSTSNDGKVLTWDLFDDRMDDIEYFEFSFTKVNKLMVIIAAVVGVIIVFLIISIIISLIIKSKEKPIEDNEPVETLDAPDTYTPVENTEKVNALLSPDGSDVNNLDKEN